VIRLSEKNTSNKIPMKKSIFDRTVIGLMLALLASATLAIGLVGAEPLSAPADSPYISPTFNGVNVMENANVFGTIKNPAAGLPNGGACPGGVWLSLNLLEVR